MSVSDTRFIRLNEKIKEYNLHYDKKLLRRAYDLAKDAHEGQLRASGEPFVNHPLEVAYILAEMEMDMATICAALLHDTVEDTTSTIEEIEEKFGPEIAMIVDGLTKISQITFQSKEEQQAENLRKMLLAMAKDIRVIIIKLADRLHNMRTLRYKSEGKQIEKAKETMEIYAPLAHRLGMTKIKWELEDLSLWYLDPDGYYELVDSIAQKRIEREEFIERTKKEIQANIEKIGIKNANVDGRAKHFYSIYRKMRKQHKTIDQVYDLFAFRIICNSIRECYEILGLVHELYKPMPNRFKDYISMPKPNMYQSLHTTLMGPEGNLFEVQIRTWAMHRTAEVGIAAHWKYKEGDNSGTNKEEEFDSKLAWIRQLLETQRESLDAEEFMKNLKIDLFTDEVFVFTPKGAVINLAQGSTPVDFAYAIHSEVGNKTVGAKVNGRIVQLNVALNNGDIVEILTSPNSNGPSKDWLAFIKTAQARNKINQWFKKEKREENIIRGRELLEREIKKLGLTPMDLLKPIILEKVYKRHNFNTYDDVLAAIGFGGITASKVMSVLKEEYRRTLPYQEQKEFDEHIGIKLNPESFTKKTKEKHHENGIIVKGIDNCLVKLSMCCNPVPGDKIVGFVTRGKGVSIHRSDCVNIINNPEAEERLIEVGWSMDDKASKRYYSVKLGIYAYDRNGLIMDVTNTIADAKLSMTAISAKLNEDHTVNMTVKIDINDTHQLTRIINKLRNIESVYSVTRKNAKT